MCTVTLVAQANGNFIITSNRDEAPNRVSDSPTSTLHKSVQMMYPVDVQSGGTWIGVSNAKRSICLLNGGFKLHKRQPPYRISRGLVVKDMLALETTDAIGSYNLKGVEPFTLIVVDYSTNMRIIEYVWDSVQLHERALTFGAHIWSSSPLYTEEMKAKRQQWFADFLSNTDEVNAKALRKFHQMAGQGNLHHGVIMDRQVVKTTSITQIEQNNSEISIWYKSLKQPDASGAYYSPNF